MANDFRRGIRVYLDSTEYKQGIDQMVNATKDLEGELQKLEAKGASLSGEDLKRKRQLENQVVKNTKAVASYKEKMKETERVLNNLSGSTYNELIRVYNRIQKELKETERGTEQYNQRLKQSKVVAKEVAAAQAEMRLAVAAGSTVVGRGVAMFGNFRVAVLGYFAAIMAGFYAIGAAFRKLSDYSKAVSELSALTGATGNDLDYLKQKSLELAKQFGASSKTIVEAMKLVGSAKPELLENVQALSDTTEAILVLSKATGMDLSQATEATTTIMNQFGMSGMEANTVVNVLAAGSKYGAVEVDYLGESISKVGTIAKSAGLTLEMTTAAMELFGEKGIRAETAGNGFKRVLVELQSDTKNYTNGLFDLNKAIENNQSISGDNIALQKKFGVEYFGLAQILLQNKERFYELTEQVTGTTVAEEQMSIATDNLSGDLDKLKGGWDAFVLSLEDGQGPVARATRGLIQLFTTALNGIASITKSSRQKADELRESGISQRLDFVKGGLKGSTTDQINYLNSTIQAEKNIYLPKKQKADDIKKQIANNKWLGGGFAKQNKELEKELAGLEKSVADSIAFVNAVGGMRANILYNKTSKVTDDAGGVSGSGGSGGNGGGTLGGNPWDSLIKSAEYSSKVQEVMYLELLKNKLIAEEQYNVMSEQLAIELLKKKKKILDDHKQDTIEIQKQILEAEIKQGDLSGKISQGKMTGLGVAPIDMDAMNAAIGKYIDNVRKKKQADQDYYDWKKEQEAMIAEIESEQAEKMQKIFGDSFGELRNVFTDFYSFMENLKSGNVKDWEDWGKNIGMIVSATLDVAQAYNDQYYAYKTASLEADKQKELTAAGDNAALREKIEKDYTQKELSLKKKQANADANIKIAQTIAAGAQAIMTAFGQLGPVGGAVAAVLIGTMTGLQVATIMKQRDAIMATTLDASGSSNGDIVSAARIGNSSVKQAARGRWDVVGAEDGQTYRSVPFSGRARTGVVSAPTLVAERGDELIVDNPTLRNIRMNAPYLLGEIKRMRVRQRASGNWSPTQDVPAAPAGSTGDVAAVLTEVSALLRWLKENRIEAYTVLGEFEKKRELRNQSLKKGSL